jgi:hypothetical protein
MGEIFTIQTVHDVTYFDQGGKAVSGSRVYFIIHDHGEGHEVDVPDITDVEAVNKRIMQVVDARERLAELGG